MKKVIANMAASLLMGNRLLRILQTKSLASA